MSQSDTRHKREMEAALKQIRARQQRHKRRWRLDVPMGRLAGEGLALFLIAFLVGRGLAVLYFFFGGSPQG